MKFDLEEVLRFFFANCLGILLNQRVIDVYFPTIRE